MNSKLYQKYLSLKIEDSSFFYLFESKNHFFFIADDALKASVLLNLNLTNLNSVISKCEIDPEQYKKCIDDLVNLNIKTKIFHLPEYIFNYDLEKCLKSQEYNKIVSSFLELDIDSLSISQAYDLLKNFQNKLKK